MRRCKYVDAAMWSELRRRGAALRYLGSPLGSHEGVVERKHAQRLEVRLHRLRARQRQAIVVARFPSIVRISDERERDPSQRAGRDRLIGVVDVRERSQVVAVELRYVGRKVDGRHMSVRRVEVYPAPLLDIVAG